MNVILIFFSDVVETVDASQDINWLENAATDEEIAHFPQGREMAMAKNY